jgi:hypothetical protein
LLIVVRGDVVVRLVGVARARASRITSVDGAVAVVVEPIAALRIVAFGVITSRAAAGITKIGASIAVVVGAVGAGRRGSAKAGRRGCGRLR